MPVRLTAFDLDLIDGMRSFEGDSRRRAHRVQKARDRRSALGPQGHADTIVDALVLASENQRIVAGENASTMYEGGSSEAMFTARPSELIEPGCYSAHRIDPFLGSRQLARGVAGITRDEVGGAG